MPFDLGWPEIVLILLVVLIIFGAGKLPQIGSSIGKGIKEFKRELRDDNESKAKAVTISNEAEPKTKS